MEGMDMTRPMESTFKGKKVLVTGHTGFKGSWLCNWLLSLGAQVIGVSSEVPTTPSIFEATHLKERLKDLRLDIRDLSAFSRIVELEQPDFLFHLAAQAIVSTSYDFPVDTITTNVIGTTNVLESLRRTSHNLTAVIITSDKCYENVEWMWGYKETDQLGGKDIYSASKAGAEVIFHGYFHSFLKQIPHLRIATARAGNVIGGGDWAKDRIISDCVRAWSEDEKVQIRSPKATRPWQHVLEPLSGYLSLAKDLSEQSDLNGESFNFGPRAEQNHTVVELIEDLARQWGFEDLTNSYEITENKPFHEASLLKLNCDKAMFLLKWRSTLAYQQTVRFVGEWYKKFYLEQAQDLSELTLNQIKEFEIQAKEQGIKWASV